MNLQEKVMTAMKDAMRAKDANALASLRAIKSEILLAQTESGAKEEITPEQEIKLLQKLVKQRKDSATIYKEQNREDLAQPEIDQALVIEQFLPEQLSEVEIAKVIDTIIAKTGASSMKDMGNVVGMTNSELAGKADGKTVAMIVKQKLS
ncbi:MAG: glutamyl-tRNA amidotransferase [Bacteroidetes bacterium HGW-Bacteroidetes-2]|jgi:hypothetical protein|nr:MAG: glutamyl-tRNA amidotransferase [Bacteroidetes bacterium HGW-Bacteroidetes-2]